MPKIFIGPFFVRPFDELDYLVRVVWRTIFFRGHADHEHDSGIGIPALS